MTASLINWFKATEKFLTPRGIVFSGPSPLTFNKSNREQADVMWKRPWAISHPESADKLWRLKGIESFAVETIWEGSMIGLLVEEWVEPEATS